MITINLNQNDESILDLIKSRDNFKLTNYEIALRLNLTVGKVSSSLTKLEKSHLIIRRTVRTYNNHWITRRIITINEHI